MTTRASVVFVTNRNGQKERLRLDKITDRITKLSEGLNVEPELITLETVSGLTDGISTSQIDELSAKNSANHIVNHFDYGTLAVRITINNLHKNTKASFSEASDLLCDHVRDNKPLPLVNPQMNEFIQLNRDELNQAIIDKNDYLYDYFGIETLRKMYLIKINGVVIERPQYLHMRIACGMYYSMDVALSSKLQYIKETYSDLSNKLYTHATPTMFNCGTMRPSCSSCFLLTCGDSMEDIANLWKDSALISKWSGGIGIKMGIRASGSYINGTGGTSKGIIGPARILNEIAAYADQGGGKRKGSIALYMEPWHADIETFINLRSHNTHNDIAARDLFYAIWTCDLFFERVKENAMWSLFCPYECPNLDIKFGNEFEQLYLSYETQKKYRKQIKAQDLMKQIITSQIQNGMPYMVNKDMVNATSNQSNRGTIQSSNLCAEIVEFSSPEETAVCNLASLNLTTYFRDGKFDFELLSSATQRIVRNLNRVININYYATDRARLSNLSMRPMGIGIQGLANVFILMKCAYGSPKSREINLRIAETIYYAAITESTKWPSYQYFEGSPYQKGIFHFEAMLTELQRSKKVIPRIELHEDWEGLRTKMKAQMGNSLLIALMPTATTAQIQGNIESFEPLTSNIYTRKTLAGEFQIVNEYLMRDLTELGLWSESMNQQIIDAQGSIKNIEGIPEITKQIYRTAYEVNIRDYLEMARDRQFFCDQSQSMNLFVNQENIAAVINQTLQYGNKLGLKTLSYYVRTNVSAGTIKIQKVIPKSGAVPLVCEMDGDCASCT